MKGMTSLLSYSKNQLGTPFVTNRTTSQNQKTGRLEGPKAKSWGPMGPKTNSYLSQTPKTVLQLENNSIIVRIFRLKQ